MSKINVEFTAPSKVFQDLKQGDIVKCFNGVKGTVKEKYPEKFYIELETREQFHVLNVKSYETKTI